MKKGLLLLTLAAPFAVMAQGPKNPAAAQEVPLVKTYQGEILKGANADLSKAHVTFPNPKVYLMKKGVTVSYIELGTTKYDLQTNASVGRRIATKNGKISATWTTSSDFDPWPSRGTGYNYYNGSTWNSSQQGTKIEPSGVRTGWPSIAYLANDSEVISAHVATATGGGFRFSKNNGPGTSFTTNSSEVLNAGSVGRPIWGRMATDGNQTIHIIANFSDSSSDNPATTKLAGVRDPMVYSRSTNGGATWDKVNTLLPGYDSTLVWEGGGDQYAIDVRGNVVAILSGGLGDPMVLWKSTDGGDNWTRTIIDSFAVLAYNGTQAIGENIPTNDGSVDVLIDNNDKVHAFWGLSQMTNRPGLTDSSLFVPGSNGLVYWNETDQVKKVIAQVHDRNNNDTLDILSGTTQFRSSIDPISGNSIGAARYGNTALVTMPSAGIDGSGNIFVIYSAPVEAAFTIDIQNYRDVFVTYSTDGGANWANTQNLTQTDQLEDVFACIPKRFGSSMPVIFQRDDEPGTALQNSDPAGDNQIMFGLIPVADITSGAFGNLTSVKEVEPKISVVLQNYPNPFSESTNVTVFMNRTAGVTLSVSNLIGQQLFTQDLGKLEQGNHNITINRNGLKSGVYFYTLSTGTSSVTGKMIVD